MQGIQWSILAGVDIKYLQLLPNTVGATLLVGIVFGLSLLLMLPLVLAPIF